MDQVPLSDDSSRVLRCSIEEAARYLGMSKQDVRIQINAGALPVERHGNTWIVLLTVKQLRKDRSTQIIPLDPAALAAVVPTTPQERSTSPKIQDQQLASLLEERTHMLQRQRDVRSNQTARRRIDWGFWLSQFLLAMLLGLAILAILALADYLIDGDAIPILPQLAMALPHSER